MIGMKSMQNRDEVGAASVDYLKQILFLRPELTVQYINQSF